MPAPMQIDQYGAGVSIHFQRNAMLLEHAWSAARNRGYIVEEVDCDSLASVEDLLKVVGQRLQFLMEVE
jgi:hypothetical protein